MAIVVGDPIPVLLPVPGVDDEEVVIVVNAVQVGVVEGTTLLIADEGVVRLTDVEIPRVVGEDAAEVSEQALGPVKRYRPMWVTSKRPAPRRVARCSAIVPVSYWTGIAQPANPMIVAPWLSCHSKREVRRRSSVDASMAPRLAVRQSSNSG